MIAEIVGEIVKLAVSPALKRLFNKRNERLKAPKGKEPIVVIEVGRPIVADAQEQFGEERVVAAISAVRTLQPEEFPKFAAEAYKALVQVARRVKGRVHIILSGPVSMNFQLGQLVGLSHLDIQIWQWFAGEYKPIPPVKREMMG